MKKLDESASDPSRPVVRDIVQSALYSDTDDDRTSSLTNLQEEVPIKITILPSTVEVTPAAAHDQEGDQGGMVVSLTPVLAGDQSSLAPGDMEIQAILANASTELSIAERHDPVRSYTTPPPFPTDAYRSVSPAGRPTSYNSSMRSPSPVRRGPGVGRSPSPILNQSKYQWLQQPDQLDQEDLHRQCRDLRVKIEQEHDGYKHKLKAMQEGAQKQTTLATKLQNKLLHPACQLSVHYYDSPLTAFPGVTKGYRILPFYHEYIIIMQVHNLQKVTKELFQHVPIVCFCTPITVSAVRLVPHAHNVWATLYTNGNSSSIIQGIEEYKHILAKLDESASDPSRPVVRDIVQSALYSDTDDDRASSLTNLQEEVPIKITILPSTVDLTPTVETVEVTPAAAHDGDQQGNIVVSLNPVLAGDQPSLAPGDMEIQAILANASTELSIAERHDPVRSYTTPPPFPAESYRSVSPAGRPTSYNSSMRSPSPVRRGPGVGRSPSPILNQSKYQWLQQPDQLDQEDLHRQCRDLRVKIEQEHDGYKHKLKAMQEGAQKQTTLATKLQNKLLHPACQLSVHYYDSPLTAFPGVTKGYRILPFYHEYIIIMQGLFRKL
eukprot:sb/3463160/